MWPSNVKENTKTHTLIYLIHTHTNTNIQHSHAHINNLFIYIFKNNQNNLDGDRQSFIYMNIQDIYNTQMVQKE